MQKPFLLIISLVIGCLFSTNVEAQFGKKIRSKLKPKPMQKTKGTSKSSAIKIDLSKERFKPAVAMHSLLKESGLKLSYDGKFSTPYLEATFLPDTDKNGNKINYNPTASNASYPLTANILHGGSDKILGTFTYYVTRVAKPFSRMHQKLKEGYTFDVQLTEGDYRMEFFVGDAHFYTYPFSVIKKTTDDPYADVPEAYFLKGDWDEWNYLFFNGDGELMWTHYLHNFSMDIKDRQLADSENKYVGIYYTLYKDGKVIGVRDERFYKDQLTNTGAQKYMDKKVVRTEYRATSDQVYGCPRNPNTPDRTINKEDLSDGKYRMEVHTKSYDGTKELSKYKFVMKNGEIQRDVRQNRSKHQDYKTIIEGGRDFYFFKKI